MATQSRYVEVARHITALGAVKRALTRALPAECPGGPAAVLSILNVHGELRMSRISELLGVDVSVTSRHVAHAAQRGWLDRLPDPADGRSRLLRLTPAGRETVAALGENAVAMIARTLAGWSDNDLDALIAMLSRLRADFGDCRITHGGPLAPDRADRPSVRPVPSVPPGTGGGDIPSGADDGDSPSVASAPPGVDRPPVPDHGDHPLVPRHRVPAARRDDSAAGQDTGQDAGQDAGPHDRQGADRDVPQDTVPDDRQRTGAGSAPGAGGQRLPRTPAPSHS